MIPAFPEFKKLELSDKEAVEKFTHRFPPYSDFNFTSLWAWDTTEERMLSVLNDNLVVRFTDYSTMEPFLSFLGDNECEKTALELLEYSKENGLPSQLRLMPEMCIKDIPSPVLSMEEDRDNFDYVYSVQEIGGLVGKKFQTKRALVNQFIGKFPDANLELIDLNNKDTQQKILSVIDVWEKNKVLAKVEYELDHELQAIKRIFETSEVHSLLAIGIFLSDTMCGFSIDEKLPNGFVISHFSKTDITKRGAPEFLWMQKCLYFETQRIAEWNFEQDLHISGLRASKLSFRPSRFLKKYKISLL